MFDIRDRRVSLLAAAVLLGGACSLARAQGPALAPAQAEASIRGKVDVERSRAYAKIGAEGLGHEHGAEGKVKSGVVHLGADADAGEVVFDMASFVCETPASRKVVGLQGEIERAERGKITASMVGASVLDVRKFPTATFRIRSAKPLAKAKPADPQLYRLDGEFTLHGVARPLVVDARTDEVEGMIHLHGQFSVKQSQHGIRPFSKFLGTVRVADEVKIWGELWLTK
jgi:polyisoprenoid-binding protein YceI